MGRKLEFNKEKAMQRATERFWAQGYDATSMRDLADRLGLHLGSVYNALGDKEKVFEEALKLHFEGHVIPALQSMTEDPNPLEALDRLMGLTVDECGGAVATPGCFLINSLLDINNINDSISQTLKSYLLKIEDAFVLCIERAIDMGQLPSSVNARKYGRFMMAANFSLRTMCKLGMPRDAISDIKDCAMLGLQEKKAAGL